MNSQKDQEPQEKSLTDHISGLGQSIIGEIELLAGVVNADPLAQAEGEFNVEVGELREELEEKVPEPSGDSPSEETAENLPDAERN